jgi:hypothetical protein
MANTTLYDLAVLQRNDPYTGLIEDVTTLAPEFTTINSMKRSGTWYEIVKRVTLPTAQFRAVNQGVSTSKSIYKKEVKEMLFLDTQLQMDEAVWDADDSSVGAVWQLEAAGAVRAASILIGQQTWYGTSADAYGFKGLVSQLSYAVKGNQTTSSTSAYLIWEDPREGVRYDVGKDGSFAISAPFRQQVLDSNSKSYFAFVGNLKSYIGLYVGSSYSVWGVTGVTSNSAAYGNGLTDAMAFQLVAGIPSARRNNLRWFINRTTEATLRLNRSAMTPSTGFAQYVPAGGAGAPAYAPLPEMLAGYPITLTDSILNTETNS